MKKLLSAKGFTLTELMVSVALGIILTAGVIEIYTGSKQTYRTQEALSRLQENARFAIEVISRDVRNSGFIGCTSIEDTSVSGQTIPSLRYDSDMAIWGRQNNGSGTTGATDVAAISTYVNANRFGDTDVLVVQGAGGCSVDLNTDMTATTDNVEISSNACGFSLDDYVLISNCGTADVFQITSNPSTNLLGHANALSTTYLDNGFTEVFPFYSNTYFIGTDSSGLPALVVVDNTDSVLNPIALVEGVESMQLQYGIDTDDDGLANQYLNAQEVGTNWSEISSVRVTLLLRTLENVNASAPGNLTLGGDELTFSDAGPIRQEFVSTIKLRNRG